MPLLVALVLLALACAPVEPAPTPADAPQEAATDAVASPDGAPDAVTLDGGRTDAAEGSVPDTLPDAPLPRDAPPQCPAGTVRCGDVCSVLGTAENCGACGVRCGARQHCGVGGCECDEDFADCDGMAANGCEVRATSPTTCGGCGGAVCPAAYSCASIAADGGRRYQCCPQGSAGTACRSTP